MPRTSPASLDLTGLYVLPMVAGFLVIYLNLDELVSDGLGNPVEKFLLFLAGAAFLASRPIYIGNLAFFLVFAAIPALMLLGVDYYQVSFDRFLRGYFSFLVPWLFLLARPTVGDASFVLRALAFAPLFCVGLGLAYEAIGAWSVFHQGFTGALRLQGSTIPAFLAAGGALGAFAAVCCARHFDQRFFVLAVVNLALVALTGGRMGLAIGLLACGFVVLLRYRITPALILKGVIAVILGIIGVVLFTPDLVLRLLADTDSGRGLLRAAIIQVWANYPNFGIGLGHQTLIVPENIVRITTTVAAHNEYIRLGVEIGLIGLALLSMTFVAFAIFLIASGPKKGDLLLPIAMALFALYALTDNALSLSVIFGLMTVAYFERHVGGDGPRRITLNLLRRRPPGR